MPLSTFWRAFVDEYRADNVYWYTPQGSTADTDDFREKFRAISEFEGKRWGQDSLPIRIHDRWLEQGLSKGSTALPRQVKRVAENLGLFLIDDNDRVQITPQGKSYLREAPGPSSVLDTQVWRYQFPNPMNESSATRGISLFPHVFLIRCLLASAGRVTNDEFMLFVSRARRSADFSKTTQRMKRWRALSSDQQQEIVSALANTKYGTIKINHSYSMAFHNCDRLLSRDEHGLYVVPSDAPALRKRLTQHGATSQIIQFDDKTEAIAFSGDPEREHTPLEALDHYIDVSNVREAVALYRKLPKRLQGSLSPDEFEAEQFLEKDLEDYLEDHLDEIEPGLMREGRGRQHPTSVGKIDLFARDNLGRLVVIELKKGRVADKVFGQICRYMGCIKAEYAAGKLVRGIIVGREIDLKLRYAAAVVPKGTVSLATFAKDDNDKVERWIRVEQAN